MRIDPLNAMPLQAQAIPLAPESSGSPSGTGTTPKTFGEMLGSALDDVNASQLHADRVTEQFAAGAPMDIHQVMIAMQEANVSLDLTVQVRNKLLDAYQEIMRTNV